MDEVRLDPDADLEEDDGTPAPSRGRKGTASGRGAAKKGNFFDEEDD